jgi:hypothetical protein
MYRTVFASIGCLLLASIAIAKESATIGQRAPEITMTGVDGKEFKLSEITGCGKNVALIFSRAHW